MCGTKTWLTALGTGRGGGGVGEPAFVLCVVVCCHFPVFLLLASSQKKRRKDVYNGAKMLPFPNFLFLFDSNKKNPVANWDRRSKLRKFGKFIHNKKKSYYFPHSSTALHASVPKMCVLIQGKVKGNSNSNSSRNSNSSKPAVSLIYPPSCQKKKKHYLQARLREREGETWLAAWLDNHLLPAFLDRHFLRLFSGHILSSRLCGGGRRKGSTKKEGENLKGLAWPTKNFDDCSPSLISERGMGHLVMHAHKKFLQ